MNVDNSLEHLVKCHKTSIYLFYIFIGTMWYGMLLFKGQDIAMALCWRLSHSFASGMTDFVPCHSFFKTPIP